MAYRYQNKKSLETHFSAMIFFRAKFLNFWMMFSGANDVIRQALSVCMRATNSGLAEFWLLMVDPNRITVPLIFSIGIATYSVLTGWASLREMYFLEQGK